MLQVGICDCFEATETVFQQFRMLNKSETGIRCFREICLGAFVLLVEMFDQSDRLANFIIGWFLSVCLARDILHYSNPKPLVTNEGARHSSACSLVREVQELPFVMKSVASIIDVMEIAF